MKAKITKFIEINDEPTPRHNEYIQEWTLTEQAQQIFLSLLVRMATNFTKTNNTDELEDFTRHASYNINKLPKPSIYVELKLDAKNILSDYVEQITQMIIESTDGNASTDLYNDYDGMDERISEQDDFWRSPRDAIDLIEELNEYEEEEQLWRDDANYSEILNTIAHYTYTNALYATIVELIEQINDEVYVTDIEEEITKDILENNDYANMKEEGIDTEDFDQVREWCEENLPEFIDEREERITKEIEAILK